MILSFQNKQFWKLIQFVLIALNLKVKKIRVRFYLNTENSIDDDVKTV